VLRYPLWQAATVPAAVPAAVGNCTGFS